METKFASGLDIRSVHRTKDFRRQVGQSLIEIALMLPFLLFLALGVIEVGRYAYISILVGNAARAGAAYAAQSPITAKANDPGTIAAGQNDFYNNLPGADSTNISISSTYYCECDNSGTITVLGQGSTCQTTSCPSGSREYISIAVTASGSYNSLFSYPGIPATLTVSSTARMRISN